MNTTLTLMSGLPRIGKSTWIESNKKDAIIVSPDITRVEIFAHQHHAMANDWIFSIGKSMTYLLLLQNKSVIIDATNIRRVDRENWYKIADQANQRLGDSSVQIRVVTVTTGEIDKDIELSMAHNLTCPKDKAVPSSVIKGMAANMSYCGDEELISLRCPNIVSSKNGANGHSYYSASSDLYEYEQAITTQKYRCTSCGEPLAAFRQLRRIVSIKYNPITLDTVTNEMIFDKMN